MPNPHPPYPPEFRAEAVKLYRGSGKSLKVISSELGVSLETLRTWVKRAQIDEGTRPGLTTEERGELRELRRKVRRLEEERDILKKAAAFFARESETR
jgi:transposase